MRQIGDPCAGLKAARCWHPSNVGALGYAWLASRNLRTALQRLQRYSRIVAQSGNFELRDTPTSLTLVIEQQRPDPQAAALAMDMVMSIIMEMCRMNYGASLQAERVTLRRHEPDCAESYRLFYGGEVVFSAHEDSLTLGIRDVDRQLPSANRQLAGLHDQVLTEQLATVARDDVVAQCKAFILEHLTSGDISLEEAAEALHMSPRTLTRRLEARDITFSALLDETRRQLAERYLADSRHSISEVAFLLGFQQQSSFTRAANRWFSMSPKEYRQSLR
jgi:AraC-like DNA-binding protein